MKILIKKIGENVYYDSKNYWFKLNENELVGYNKLQGTIYPHVRKELAEFSILPAQQEQLLESSLKKVVPDKPGDTDNIAPRDRGKPDKYTDVAYQALFSGD